MREWKDQAVVLRLGHFHEADVWFRALVREHGLCTIFAFGATRSRRRFCGCLDVLNTLDGRVTRSLRGGYLVLQEATLVRAPAKLRTDWRGMGIMANCLQFVDKLAIGPESARESFILIEDLRGFLESGRQALSYVPIFFRLRLAVALGYEPDLRSCARCGGFADGGGLFLANEGRLLCASCAARARYRDKKHGYSLYADAGQLLRMIKGGLPSQWRLSEFSVGALRQAARAVDGFVQFHLGF